MKSTEKPTRAAKNWQRDIDEAAERGELSPGAVENIRLWITDPRYAEYSDAVLQHIADGRWRQLDDVFWTTIPFGTGGRRGMMYPIGCNAINDRTIGESAQGLAKYVQLVKRQGPWSCAIAYDTRHQSRHFAELCAGIMVANGFTVYFLNDYRSTPQLSFLVRHKKCDCGIMVTASHNPPSDNAVKVYWNNGAQLVPPHDQAVIDQVMAVEAIDVVEFSTAVDNGQIKLCLEEIDRALLAEHKRQSFGGSRDVRIIYSPLHGVGEFNIRQLFEDLGFHQLEIFEPHRQPDGNFSNVPDHIANPENRKVFDAIIHQAKTSKADLILATDPDADRMGAAAPLTLDCSGPWETFTGNQLSAMLGEFILRRHRERGTLTSNSFIVSTLVTTQMVARIAEAFNVTCFDNNLVGFKWICNVMEQQGPDDFVYGTEESHGYLVGQYVRDKDGIVACMLMSELAAECKQNGLSLHQHLEQLYQTYGFFYEQQKSITLPGSDGLKRMQALMGNLRNSPPESLGGLDVVLIRDYLAGKQRMPNGAEEPLDGPRGDLVILLTQEPGNYVAVRPSGTEPKVKMYSFAYVPPVENSDSATTRAAMRERLDQMAVDLQRLADSV